MRDRERKRRNFIYSAGAVLVLALLWIVTFQGRQTDAAERTRARIVVLGDSLVGQCRDKTSVTERLSVMLGEPVFNGAMGGTCMTPLSGMREENYSKELLNMVSLSKAIAADDFGVQQTARSRQAVTEYFGENIDALARIDFDSVEILVLEYGLNDYHAAVPIENEKFRMDEDTYAGAMRSVVKTLRDCYPDLRIVMVTPTYTWYVPWGQTCEEYDTGNGFLEKYVDAQLAVAEELGIEAVDLYHEAYTHDAWEDWTRYTEDGLHPNGKSRKKIAKLIAAQLLAEP